MRAFFDTYGFVVVRDVVDTTQVRATLQEVWDTVITAPQPAASTKPVAPADPSTWGASNWPSSASVANGMTTKEVQFTPAFLENRGNPRVAATCAVLLRTHPALGGFPRPRHTVPRQPVRVLPCTVAWPRGHAT